MTTTELLESVKRAGGVLETNGDKLKCQLPEDALHFTDLLRERKQELIEIVKARGGRVATFPRCPRCCSSAMYRANNVGDFECLTCEMQGISEVAARRVQ